MFIFQLILKMSNLTTSELLSQKEAENQVKVIKGVLVTKLQSFSGLVQILLTTPLICEPSKDYLAYTDDKTIRLGKEFFLYNKKKKVFTIVHELLHILLAHVPRARMLGLTSRIKSLALNLAYDAIINKVIENYISACDNGVIKSGLTSEYIEIPKDVILFEGELFEGALREKPAEHWSSIALFTWLLKEQDKHVQELLQYVSSLKYNMEGDSNSDDQNDGSESGNEGKGENRNKSGNEDKGENGNERLKSAAYNTGDLYIKEGGFKDIKADSSLRGTALSESDEERIRSAEANLNRIIKNTEAGSGLGNILASLGNDLPKVKPNWKKILKAFLHNRLNPVRSYNYNRPSRNSISGVLPFYTPKLDKSKGVRNLTVLFDTSGSCWSEEIQKTFFANIESVKDITRCNLTLITFDSDVKNVFYIENHKGSIWDTYIKGEISINGGGGTDFKPPFKAAFEQDEVPDVVVMFSDGYGDFPNPNTVPKPTLFAMTTDEVAPFGTTIEIY